jgi:guanylate kinase
MNVAEPAMASVMPKGWTPGGFLLVISGPSGAGKGTLVERLMQARPDCRFSVSATTRAPRGSEQDGREYFFLDREEFVRRREAGGFLESAEVHGNLYGTLLQEVRDKTSAGHVVVLDIDVQGAAQVREKRPDAVSVFVTPPSLEVLRERLQGRRTEPADTIELRMRNAASEIPQYVHYDYLVVNDRLEDAARRLVEIHDVERLRVSRLAPNP